jgi:hypothetical protein
VSELALDDVQGHALVGELQDVGAGAVRHEAPAQSRARRSALEIDAGRESRPRPPSGAAADHAEQRADRIA